MDDGYASKANLEGLAGMGVPTASFSGSKGRKLAGDAWDCGSHVNARAARPAAEARIFTLKHNHALGSLRRRSLNAVKPELMEKCLAYNALQIVRLLAKRTAEESAICVVPPAA